MRKNQKPDLLFEKMKTSRSFHVTRVYFFSLMLFAYVLLFAYNNVCEKFFLGGSADAIKKGKMWFLKACRNQVVLHFPLYLLGQK